MAVFTDVTLEQASDLLKNFNIGEPVEIKGILSGIENSNFYLKTTTGLYVLTIFERLSEQQLPYYLRLTRHLGDKGLSVSAPVEQKDGSLYGKIQGKPFAIAPCLPGKYVPEPSAEACADMGRMLARMHLAVKDFPLSQKNTKGLEFWLESLPLLKPHIPAELFTLLSDEVARQQALMETSAYKALPAGAVHADLFRNNAIIETDSNGREKIGGVFDFFFACNAPFLYDLAVTVNDWCINLETGEFIEEKIAAFLNAYHSVLPLTCEDKAMWKDILCAAALRFWVSRLYDYYLPREASMLKPHDPRHFERILLLRRNASEQSLPWITE